MKISAYTLDFSLFLQFKNNLIDLVGIKTDLIPIRDAAWRLASPAPRGERRLRGPSSGVHPGGMDRDILPLRV